MWVVLVRQRDKREQHKRALNSTCLKLILRHAVLIIVTSFKVWNMQMIHTYAEKVWMLEDINFDTIFFISLNLLFFQIVGGEIFPESKQDDDDPLQMGGDFTLNRLPGLLTN